MTTPSASAAAKSVIDGLSQQQKMLSPVWLYDQRGSEIFSKIMQLAEYYPTGAELQIWQNHTSDIVNVLGEQPLLIEQGAGDSSKSRRILDALKPPAAYIPCDISGEFLLAAAAKLQRQYPRLTIAPVVTEFNAPFDVPNLGFTPGQTTVLLAGSTIGNHTYAEAVELLRAFKQQAGEGGQLLIGADLVKDVDVLLAAYNDRSGVTAEFNLNVLAHLNSALGADFDLGGFSHRAVYDWHESRIVMQLVSRCAQTVNVGGVKIDFKRDEVIVTEYSHKYTRERLAEMAAAAGLSVTQTWLDEKAWFSMNLLR